MKGKLEEEGRQRKSEQEANEKVDKEPTVLLEQVEMARADAVNEYKASQPFIDFCGGYYGEGFEDCLKQVKSLYPHLDFSKINMDEPLPVTLCRRKLTTPRSLIQRMVVLSSPSQPQMPPSPFWSRPLSL